MAWWNPLSWGSRGESKPRGEGAGQHTLYDAADTSSEDRNKAHFDQYADAGSAAAANDPETRRVLRDRSRGECANNGYAKAAIRRKATDIVGRGPQTRAKVEGNDAFNKWANREYALWCKAIGRNPKLRVMCKSFKRDGEGPAVLVSNPKVKHPVKLDLRPTESEQFSSPLSAYGGWGEVKDRNGNVAHCVVDGILFDELGNVLEYHVLRNHPGDIFRGDPFAFDRVAPEHVIFWMERDRPGQARGIPATTPALPLLAQLRRYLGATLDTCETQSKISAVLELPASASTAEDGEEGTADLPASMPIKRGTIITTPEGGAVKVLAPSQPSTNLPQFKREILAECGAGIGLPYHKMAKDSSTHNYSSARLDEQGDDEEVEVDEDECADQVLDPLYDAWLTEAALLRGYMPADVAAKVRDAVARGLDLSSVVPRSHLWSGPRYIDPVKESTAIQIQLESHLTTLEDEWAKRGHDWREKLAQRAEEIKFLRANDLTPAEALPGATSAEHPANRPEPKPERPADRDQGDEEQTAGRAPAHRFREAMAR